LRAQLTAWRENDGKLQPLAQRSFLVKEVSATSRDLATLAAVGLLALDFVIKGQRPPEDWKAQQLAILEQIQKPKDQLLLMPTPAIQKLVEAASAGGACSSSS
jgi:hexosaminidase